MNLTPVSREYATFTVAATEDGQPVTLTAVDVALLPPRTSPAADTAWTTADYSAGVATVLLAGPAADPSGALVVPVKGADLWVRVTDVSEVDAARVARITVV